MSHKQKGVFHPTRGNNRKSSSHPLFRRPRGGGGGRFEPVFSL